MSSDQVEEWKKYYFGVDAIILDIIENIKGDILDGYYDIGYIVGVIGKEEDVCIPDFMVEFYRDLIL